MVWITWKFEHNRFLIHKLETVGPRIRRSKTFEFKRLLLELSPAWLESDLYLKICRIRFSMPWTFRINRFFKTRPCDKKYDIGTCIEFLNFALL